MESIPLNNTTGWGPDGRFQASMAIVQEHLAGVDIDVLGDVPALPGPIRLELGPQDAHDLGRGLIEAAGRARAGFSSPQTAIGLLDAFLQALAASAWLEAPEHEVIRREMASIKELLALSGDT